MTDKIPYLHKHKLEHRQREVQTISTYDVHAGEAMRVGQTYIVVSATQDQVEASETRTSTSSDLDTVR